MKVILYMAITINGYIAGLNNDTSWLTEEEWNSFKKMIKKTGNYIIGRRTYELMRDNNELQPGTTVVLSRKADRVDDGKDIHIVRSPKQAIELLKEKGFKEALVAGGGSLNESFMKEGLVDEIYIDIEAHVLGKGVRLFGEHEFEYDLKLLEVNKITENTVQLHYKVIH